MFVKLLFSQFFNVRGCGHSSFYAKGMTENSEDEIHVILSKEVKISIKGELSPDGKERLNRVLFLLSKTLPPSLLSGESPSSRV